MGKWRNWLSRRYHRALREKQQWALELYRQMWNNGAPPQRGGDCQEQKESKTE
ncbi:MAG: hypothetical protein ACOX7F_09765 [Eubacteriales bacterium]|jgi:hypothetical protein